MPQRRREAIHVLPIMHGRRRISSALKTYLLFLSCMPDVVRGIKGQDIISSEISVDMNIAEILREIK